MFSQLLEFSGNHPILMGSFFALLGYILFSEYRNLTEKFNKISPSGAIQLINQEDSLLLDVRETKEVKEGAIAGYKHIALASLEGKLSELQKYKEKDIIVYCRTGHRSASACRTLTKNGFEKVSNLAGGILAWQDAQLPITRK